MFTCRALDARRDLATVLLNSNLFGSEKRNINEYLIHVGKTYIYTLLSGQIKRRLENGRETANFKVNKNTLENSKRNFGRVIVVLIS